MDRTRLTLGTLLAVAFVAVAGVGLAAVAHLAAGSATSQASRLPELTRFLPADSGFVGYVDLKSLLQSPLRDQWEQRQGEKYIEELEDFRSLTGIDPRSDLDAASFATVPVEKPERSENRPPSRFGLAVSGNFQPDRLVAALGERLARQEAQATLERSTYRNTALYLLRFKEEPERGRRTQALAFPNSTTALFGTPERVKAMLDTGAGQAAPFAASQLGRWLEEEAKDDAAWVAGSAEGGFTRFFAREAGAAVPGLPPLKYFVLSARFGQFLEAFARGEASDPDSARKLAEVVRGFIALGSLQQPQKPELAALLNAVQIETSQNRVEVSLAIPYETLERLAAQHRKAEAQE